MPLDENWRKPSRSANGSDCMIVRRAEDGMIEVGDDKVTGGHVLRFTVSEWEAAVDGFKQGEFDL
ncbi:DUF397 domain-containing protein [Planosporangium flavigriseum]|uniref:DUF397 domain-containing protein n=1 Tax=Planosporangium flavigriseum TaxID=373681 RepID=A0A8J3LIV9_9ACTN|nr:DUF397 domain-containing protein [Planosporangium flavigriseum]NJC64394.1 DUF397 domain-containing protein [Planosporangium flavigriseum]GIG72134.1 hypothetical protein Pfl04_05380 [Planosporangium flavigriseum]